MARQAEIDVRFLPCTWKQIYCQNGRHLFRRLNLVCLWEQVCQQLALLYNTRSEKVSRSPSPQPCPYIQVTGPRRHIPVNGAMHSTSEQVLHSHFLGQITETFAATPFPDFQAAGFSSSRPQSRLAIPRVFFSRFRHGWSLLSTCRHRKRTVDFLGCPFD